MPSLLSLSFLYAITLYPAAAPMWTVRRMFKWRSVFTTAAWTLSTPGTFMVAWGENNSCYSFYYKFNQHGSVFLFGSGSQLRFKILNCTRHMNWKSWTTSKLGMFQTINYFCENCIECFLLKSWSRSRPKFTALVLQDCPTLFVMFLIYNTNFLIVKIK